MPVNDLYVEGNIDQRIVVCVLQGLPAVHARGTKDDLHHIVRREMADGKVGLAYLRDRDFDHEPPANVADGPTVDRQREGIVQGYRWARTEIENYLLEPRLAAPALGVNAADLVFELNRAAASLRFYTAGRWTLGQLRARTRRVTHMQTRPDNTHGQAFPLPASFTEVDTLSWVVRVVEEIKGAAASEFDAAGAKAEFERYKALLTGKSGDEVLLWFSGKDLFGTLESFFRSSGINDPAAARETILRWMEQPENLATVMAALPEWRNLVRVVNE